MWIGKTAFRGSMACALFAGIIFSAPASATKLPQSWNGWHWSRTGLLTIQVGDNVSKNWDPYLANAAKGWSAAPEINYKVTTGKTSSSTCGAVFGTLQVCSGDYGKTGWLGYTDVWVLGTQIVQARVRLNDYYFTQAKYDNAAFRQYVACQELGNALGLQDSDRSYGNSNSGSCMDYTNDASGTNGRNGTLANVAPSASDMTNLSAIYAEFDSSQLAQTKLTKGGNAFNVPGSVPEPASWTMMLGGFGLLGYALRRTRRTVSFA